jgi:hypothetical protein
MTNAIEMTVTAIDTPPEQTVQERLRFQLDFMLMMLNVGRDKEANEACARLYKLIDELEG